jgi:hypothetical protein
LACAGRLARHSLVLFLCLASLLSARERWTELNLGPFYIDAEGDTLDPARQDLADLEQLRWVLGGLLESQDLPSVWPFRVLVTKSAKTNPTPSTNGFVLQNGQYLLLTHPGEPLPLAQVAKILLDANTPRLPPEVESGLPQLFATLKARGSRVTWGAPPVHPDLNWARMQLFATRFEYTSSFHIFVTSLKDGSTLSAAETNAFGQPRDVLEKQAAANLALGNWQAVPVPGRPLDPKRDFGEHELPAAVAAVYLADLTVSTDPKSAEAAYKAAVEAGPPATALGYEGLAQVAKLEKQNPKPFLEDAIRAGSRSAPVYVADADGQPPAEALQLLKKASQLSPLWAEPVHLQAELATTPAEREALLKKAVQLDPRMTRYWIELAGLQTVDGHALDAQGSWLRAEDSAPAGPERDRVHEQRVRSEQERLDAADRERRQEREAVHLTDQQAQESEADRIRAAEAKANATLNAEAGGNEPTNVVPWDAMLTKKKVAGMLVRVECLHSGDRLSIKDRSGQILLLYLKDADQLKLSCGTQTTPRRVSVAYINQRDDDRHTAGNVTDIEFR